MRDNRELVRGCEFYSRSQLEDLRAKKPDLPFFRRQGIPPWLHGEDMFATNARGLQRLIQWHFFARYQH